MWDCNEEQVHPHESGPFPDDTQNRLIESTDERQCYLSFITNELNEIKIASSLSLHTGGINNEPQVLDSTNPRASHDDHTSEDDDIQPMSEAQPNGKRTRCSSWNSYTCLSEYINKLTRYSKPSEYHDRWILFEKSQMTQSQNKAMTLSIQEYYGDQMTSSISESMYGENPTATYDNYDWTENDDSHEVQLYDVKKARKSFQYYDSDNLNSHEGYHECGEDEVNNNWCITNDGNHMEVKNYPNDTEMPKWHHNDQDWTFNEFSDKNHDSSDWT